MACKWPIANIPCHAPSAGKVNVRFWPKADINRRILAPKIRPPCCFRASEWPLTTQSGHTLVGPIVPVIRGLKALYN